jgi:sodium-coupled neutral amino acid transporter 11
MLVYLALSMTTTHFALRKSLDALLAGPEAPFTWLRHVALTLLILGASASVALCFPGASDRIFNLTGATGVCVVCYIIPCYIHFRVLAHQRRAVAGGEEGGEEGGVREPLLRSLFQGQAAQPLGGEGEGGEGEGGREREQQEERQQEEGCARRGSKAGAWAGAGCGMGARSWLQEVAVPVVVLLLGTGFSAAALWVAVRGYVRDHEAPQ